LYAFARVRSWPKYVSDFFHELRELQRALHHLIESLRVDAPDARRPDGSETAEYGVGSSVEAAESVTVERPSRCSRRSLSAVPRGLLVFRGREAEPEEPIGFFSIRDCGNVFRVV